MLGPRLLHCNAQVYLYSIVECISYPKLGWHCIFKRRIMGLWLLCSLSWSLLLLSDEQNVALVVTLIGGNSGLCGSNHKTSDVPFQPCWFSLMAAAWVQMQQQSYSDNVLGQQQRLWLSSTLQQSYFTLHMRMPQALASTFSFSFPPGISGPIKFHT